MFEHKQDREHIQIFFSPEEYLHHINTNQLSKYWQNYSSTWAPMSGSDALKALEFGDTKHLAAAEALVSKMSEEDLFRTGQKLVQTSVVGEFPNVPAYLMGQPETMFVTADSDVYSTTTPIRIFVALFCSAHITSEEYQKRGIALLGLVLALKQVRPVELYVVSISATGSNNKHNHAFGTCIKIETNPLDLGRATFMLCDVSFTRQLTYTSNATLSGINYFDGEYLPWPWGCYDDSEMGQLEQHIRRVVHAEPQDVVIPGMRMHDTSYRTDPMGWIKTTLKKYSEL